jgi:hypothetical protein
MGVRRQLNYRVDYVSSACQWMNIDWELGGRGSKTTGSLVGGGLGAWWEGE